MYQSNLDDAPSAAELLDQYHPRCPFCDSRDCCGCCTPACEACGKRGLELTDGLCEACARACPGCGVIVEDPRDLDPETGHCLGCVAWARASGGAA